MFVARVSLRFKSLPTKSQPADLKRRTPVQARAVDTMEIILEAAAQILQKEGRSALNTNHIAERAGISVGTLYQYFSNKHAILIEIARREIERDKTAVMSAIQIASERNSTDPAREGIRALLASQRKQTKVRRAAFDALLAEGLGQFGFESSSAIQQITAMIAMNRDKLFSKQARQPSAAMLFVISRAVAGVIRSAIVEESPLLGTPEFENELVRLVRAYFTQSTKAHSE